MGNKKTANSSNPKKQTKSQEIYKCHTFSPGEPQRRKKPIWTAKAVCCSTKKPELYNFFYDRLLDIDDIKGYKDDLEYFFNPDLLVVKPKFADYAQLIKNDDMAERCEECPHGGNCYHKESFSKVYEIHYSLDLKTCPIHGIALTTQSHNSPTGFSPIHDVRLKGHPTLLYFHKTERWRCRLCKKTISGLRVPGIQHIKKGELTLRLIRSLFELSLEKVPNEYVAEGYFLTTDRVGLLSRQFKTKTREAFEKEIIKIFSGKAIEDFHNEYVYIDDMLFRAVFTKDKKTFLALLSEDELSSVWDFLSGRTEELNMFMAEASCNLTASYFLTTIPMVARKIVVASLELVSAFTDDYEKAYKRHDYDMDRLHALHHFSFLPELTRFTREAYSSCSIDMDAFRNFLIDYKPRIPMTCKKTLQRLKHLQKAIEKAQEDVNQWEDQFPNETRSVCDWKAYSREDIENMPRLDISELIESCSKKSDLSLNEQLARLQYYNELSVFPISPSEQEKFPVLNEKGWPSFENTRLGQGIPVECLNRLLRYGLLDKDTLPAACIRQRLGLYKHKCAGGSCTIKDCPFLG